ncbi:hypothetical protein AAF134_09945 [Synechococcus lacustris Tous-12m]
MSLPLLAYPLSSQNSRVAPPGEQALRRNNFYRMRGDHIPKAAALIY